MQRRRKMMEVHGNACESLNAGRRIIVRKEARADGTKGSPIWVQL